MFFRNQKPHEWTFDERLGNLKQFRFDVKSQGSGALVTRDGCGAIVENLAPGNYTAIVRGKNDTTGVALVEVYSLQ